MAHLCVDLYLFRRQRQNICELEYIYIYIYICIHILYIYIHICIYIYIYSLSHTSTPERPAARVDLSSEKTKTKTKQVLSTPGYTSQQGPNPHDRPPGPSRGQSAHGLGSPGKTSSFPKPRSTKEPGPGAQN